MEISAVCASMLKMGGQNPAGYEAESDLRNDALSHLLSIS